MAHWIIEDRGFAGQWYKCSECGKIHNDLYSIDVSDYDCCPDCGAAIDEENEYVEEKSENKTKTPEPYPGLKELNSWSVGGNSLSLEEGCDLTLYYEDERGNTSDDVFIRLTPMHIDGLIAALNSYRKGHIGSKYIYVSYTYSKNRTYASPITGQENYLYTLDRSATRLTLNDIENIIKEICDTKNVDKVVITNVLFLED